MSLSARWLEGSVNIGKTLGSDPSRERERASARNLIFRRNLLDVVDDDEIVWKFTRFELEAELLDGSK